MRVMAHWRSIFQNAECEAHNKCWVLCLFNYNALYDSWTLAGICERILANVNVEKSTLVSWV